METVADTPATPVFAPSRPWREAFLAIAREVENAPPEAFQPSVSPVRRIPLARPRARS